jgi:hypothetical protein
MVEVNGSSKQSSLLQYGNNYGRNKFYSTAPRAEVNDNSKQSSLIQYVTITAVKSFLVQALE